LLEVDVIISELKPVSFNDDIELEAFTATSRAKITHNKNRDINKLVQFCMAVPKYVYKLNGNNNNNNNNNTNANVMAQAPVHCHSETSPSSHNKCRTMQGDCQPLDQANVLFQP